MSQRTVCEVSVKGPWEQGAGRGSVASPHASGASMVITGAKGDSLLIPLYRRSAEQLREAECGRDRPTLAAREEVRERPALETRDGVRTVCENFFSGNGGANPWMSSGCPHPAS